jgi:hypothetical protein
MCIVETGWLSDPIGRINNISLAPSPKNTLQPMFEALMNLIHAIEERFGSAQLSSALPRNGEGMEEIHRQCTSLAPRRPHQARHPHARKLARTKIMRCVLGGTLNNALVKSGIK